MLEQQSMDLLRRDLRACVVQFSRVWWWREKTLFVLAHQTIWKDERMLSPILAPRTCSKEQNCLLRQITWNAESDDGSYVPRLLYICVDMALLACSIVGPSQIMLGAVGKWYIDGGTIGLMLGLRLSGSSSSSSEIPHFRYYH